MKLSVMQENLARGLAVASRAVSIPEHPAGPGQRPPPDRGRRPQADRDEPRDRDHLLGARQDRRRTARSPSRPSSSPTSSPALPAGDRVDLELQAGDTLQIRAGRFETHVKGIDAEEFPAIPTAGERPTTRIAQKRPPPGPRRGDVRRRERRGPADPDRRPRPLRGRPADPCRRRQLPDRRQDDRDARSGRGDEPRRPRPLATELEPGARRRRRPGRRRPRAGKNQILFHLEGIDLVSRLIDGQFPNYQQVLPKSHTTRAVVEREELLKAVRLAALIASASANIVKLRVGVDGDAGHHRHRRGRGRRQRGPGRGDRRGRRDDDRVQRPLPVDVLQNVTVDQFALELNGPLSPGVFKPIGDDAYVHVVMPVRTTC